MKQALVHAVLAAWWLTAAQAQEATEAGTQTIVASKEYFVPQQADEVIVVRVSAYEAEFITQLSTEEGENLAESAQPDARMLPIYQFAPAPQEQRQVHIDVAATQVTDNTEFDLQIIRINPRDTRANNLATGYKLLSQGTETLAGGTIPGWTVKIQTLMSASNMFEELGMQEMKLWSYLYATHLILYRMRDRQTSSDWAAEILATPRIERYELIQFAARKILSTALAGIAEASSGDEALAAKLQNALKETIQSARALGYRYEESLALQAMGVALNQRGNHAEALQKLEQALEIAVSIGAGDLAASVREHIVEIHDLTGDDEATGSVLQDIETHLVETGENEELARNLLQQGRLLLEAHRYPEAIDILTRATALEQSSLMRIELELALGSALNEAGRGEEALPHLMRAVTQPGTGDFRQPSTMLDLGAALGTIAAIHRRLGAFEEMARFRTTQREFLRNIDARTQWAYEYAIDALWQRGANSSQTLDRFDRSYQEATAPESSAWRALSLLRLCALPDKLGAGDARCAAERLQRAFDAATNSGTSRQAAEASLAYTSLLRARGQSRMALEIAEEQIDDLLTNGHAVLGSWYWQWREPLFDNYMQLVMSSEPGSGRWAGAPSLLALAKVRFVERGGAQTRHNLDEAGLQGFVQALPAEATVLSYYLTPEIAYAWTGGPRGVDRIQLQRAREIDTALGSGDRRFEAMDDSGFESQMVRLGGLLLEPIADRLPKTIYLVAHGNLLGIPFDALYLDGESLIANRDLVNLTAFPIGPDPVAAARFETPEQVFLAGDPQDWSGEYATRLQRSAEVTAVSERFVGPGLHAVEGVSLLVDEFADQRYGDADLVHLSIPGTIDFSPQRQSRLFLSEAASGQGRQQLNAATLRTMPLQAELVVFSRTEFVGTAEALESDVGVISSALEAGARAALASLWPVSEESRQQFVIGFYDGLQRSGDAATALALAKRSAMGKNSGPDWSSFQLFLN